jgi:ribonuclease R
MSKAKYSTTDNIGHYGLAFDYYSHLHHLFVATLTLWYTVCYILSWWWKISRWRNLYEAKCLHSSTMEGLATSAERIPSNTCRWNTCKIIKIKFFRCNFRCYWMGNFVEIIENKCEGMCRIRDIKMIITFDSEQYALVGQILKITAIRWRNLC